MINTDPVDVRESKKRQDRKKRGDCLLLAGAGLALRCAWVEWPVCTKKGWQRPLAV